jgi:hypothetical protein
MQLSILNKCYHLFLRNLPTTLNEQFLTVAYLILHQTGFTLPYFFAEICGELLPHHFTLTLRQAQGKPCSSKGRYIFCCTFHRLTTPGCYPAFCSMVFGLSSLFTLANKLAQLLVPLLTSVRL